MKTSQDVLIEGSRHLIIHGQFGNLHAKISELRAALVTGGFTELLRRLEDIARELEYLRQVYPHLDGGFEPVDEPVRLIAADPHTPEVSQSLKMTKIRNGLRDLRALADAAYVSYTHEGTIACHLKVMFDEAWSKAADEAELDGRDGIPF